MVRKITWTKRAKNIYFGILDFYFHRNGSITYSIKLNKEVTEIIELLKHYPNLGKKTNYKDLRVIVKSNYKIYYKVKQKEINIRLIWDSRQNPEDFTID